MTLDRPDSESMLAQVEAKRAICVEQRVSLSIQTTNMFGKYCVAKTQCGNLFRDTTNHSFY